MTGRTLGPVERALGWMIGVPFASWRYVARDIEIRRDDSTCPWPIEGFPEDNCAYPGESRLLQRPRAGFGAAIHRRYRVRVQQAQLSAREVMAIVRNNPNVACPLEIARFERKGHSTAPIEIGEEMRVRLPGPWNGPVRVVELDDCSFRLATMAGHMEAGEIEFRAHDDGAELLFEIESWARSGDRLFAFFYDRLGVARELQLDMWAFFLERVAQISGGTAAHGIEVESRRCDEVPA